MSSEPSTQTGPETGPQAGPMGPTGTDRLHSLDALRGFDMFWIVGGGALLAATAQATDWPLLHGLAEQAEHVEWHGFRLWDLIFPLFLFVSGVALPFSMARRLEQGRSRLRLHADVVRRGLTLVLLGVVYNGLLTFDFAHLRYASVLGRIGLGWMFAALIFLNTGTRGRIAWLAFLLLAYWAALSWIPVPGIGAGVLEPGKTLTDWLDRQLLPGRLHRVVRDPEGILSTVPAIGNALLGALAGQWLRGGWSASGTRKGLWLLAGGALLLALGGLWSLVFPLNKNLWTSSFTLWTSGLSALFLGAFYLVIDVWGLRRWAFFFEVIGKNAITIYLLNGFVDFDALAGLVFVERRVHPAVLVALAIGLRWAILYALHKKRVYLRV